MTRYSLLDSGLGEKLERFGEFVLRRPDPEALWPKGQGEKVWQSADMAYKREGNGGKWSGKPRREGSGNWICEHGSFKFLIKPTSFKHVGLFPEQIENWRFIASAVAKFSPAELALARGAQTVLGKNFATASAPKILNLFAYTGGATLAALAAGAEVTHVDASKPVVDWTRENLKLNNLELPAEKEDFLVAGASHKSSLQKSSFSAGKVRFIVDDAFKFVEREVRRGNKYDAIIMDPPAFGHGPKGELWKIERDFLPLFESCVKLLSERPLFFIISGYASGYSGSVFANNLRILKDEFGGQIEEKELFIEEENSRKFRLPAGVTARWFL